MIKVYPVRKLRRGKPAQKIELFSNGVKVSSNGVLGLSKHQALFYPFQMQTCPERGEADLW